jgi:hypothetical protein
MAAPIQMLVTTATYVRAMMAAVTTVAWDVHIQTPLITTLLQLEMMERVSLLDVLTQLLLTIVQLH